MEEGGMKMAKQQSVNNPETPDNSALGQGVITPNQNYGQGGGTDSQLEQPQKEAQAMEEDADRGLPKDYERLRAEFTRRTQEWAKKEKELEELKAFRDQLMNDPSFKEYLEARSKPKQEPNWDEMTEEEKALLTLQNYFQKFTEPYEKRISELERYIQYQLYEQGVKIWNDFIKEHPDAVEIKDQIAELMEKHNLDLDKAYKIIKADELREKGKQEALKELEAKRSANLEIPGRTPSSISKPQIKDIWDAYRLSKEQLNIK